MCCPRWPLIGTFDGAFQRLQRAPAALPFCPVLAQYAAETKFFFFSYPLPQVTGEAIYTDDLPRPPNAVQAALIMSDRPHATLLSIDVSAALSAPGVVGAYTAEHIPGHNLIGPVLHDEQLFVAVGSEVLHVGQPLGVVVAETEAEARAAAKLVVCTYADLPVRTYGRTGIRADVSFLAGGHCG